MANEQTAMISDEGRVFGAVVQTGSVVAGDWVFASQTATDDMFAGTVPDPTTWTTGSVAIQRGATGANNDKTVGIVLNDASSGERVNVATEGFFLCISNAGVTAGDKVQMGAGGQKLIDYNDDASGVGFIVGRALTGTSAADKIFYAKVNV